MSHPSQSLKVSDDLFDGRQIERLGPQVEVELLGGEDAVDGLPRLGRRVLGIAFVWKKSRL